MLLAPPSCCVNTQAFFRTPTTNNRKSGICGVAALMKKTMKKIVPLTENHMYSKAYSGGATDVNKLFAVYALKNYKRDKNGCPVATTFGITVNRKLGKAVQRNRIKRLFRRAYMECAENIQEGRIIVVSARAAMFASDIKCDRVKELMQTSFNNLGLFNGQTFKGTDGRKKLSGNRPQKPHLKDKR